MAERHRSKDKTRDTDKIMGEKGAPSGQGRDGGRLAREIGSTDELKRSNERPAGATRVTKENEEEKE